MAECFMKTVYLLVMIMVLLVILLPSCVSVAYVPELPFQTVEVIAPDPVYVARPGEMVTVEVVVRFRERQEGSVVLFEYEVVDRKGNVINTQQYETNVVLRTGAVLRAEVAIPEDYDQRWIGVQLVKCKVNNEEMPLRDQPPFGLAVKQDGPMYPEGALGNILGVNQHYTQGMSHEYLRLLTELGVKWARDNVSWALIEQTPGVYEFPEAFEKRLRFYEENDIALSFTLFGPNRTAYPDDPYNPEAYGRFAAEVARKLSEDYDLEFILILWNEPNNFGFRQDFGGQWYGAPPSPWVEEYVKVANAGAKAIHAYDPSILTFTNSDVITNHYWFIDKGLAPEIKGFSIHPYGSKAGHPEIQGYGNNQPWIFPFRVMDDDQSTRSMFLRLRDAYAEELGHTPEMVVTEFGRLIEGVWEPGQAPFAENAEHLVAEELPRFFILMASLGVKSAQWFTLADWRSERGHGLVFEDGQRRLTFTAYKTLSLELGHYRLVEQIVGADSPFGVQAYLFEGSEGYKLAIWDTRGTSKVLITRDSTDPVRIVTHLGEELPVYHEGEVLEVDIGRGPLYISGVGSGCQVQIP